MSPGARSAMKPRFRRAQAVLVCALVLIASAVGRAQTKSEAELESARQLFKQATEYENQQQWGQAATYLVQAIRIKDTPGLRYHLAYCREQQGQLKKALLNYERAQLLLQRGADAEDVRELLKTALPKLRRRLPLLEVELPSGVDHASVRVDDETIAESAKTREITLDPGSHVVRVTAAGYRDFTQTVELAEGQHRTVKVVLFSIAGPAPREATAPEPDKASQGRQPSRASSGSGRTVVIVLGAALTAGGAAAGVAGLLEDGSAKSRADAASAFIDKQADDEGVDSEGACSTATDELLKYCEELKHANDDREAAQTLAMFGFIGAGVAAVLTTLTAIVWKPNPDTDVSYQVSVDATQASFRLRARF